MFSAMGENYALPEMLEINSDNHFYLNVFSLKSSCVFPLGSQNLKYQD